MNPQAAPCISPGAILASLILNRGLIVNLIRREVIGRYRGSVMGILWSFLNPILMLSVYTFVFSMVFKARWAGGSESKTEFALILFSGLMIFNLFSECINRAPVLILSNVNYVKKVVFPLEILPWVTMGSSAFHMVVSLAVWLLFYGVFIGVPSLSILLLPVVLLPLFLLTLGLSWLLASLGVFLRDLAQVTSVVTMMLLFLSPIFYPLAALPENYQAWIHLSPLTVAVEQARAVMILGKTLDWGTWLIYFLVSILITGVGFAWFQKTRRGFADVL